MSSKHDDRIGRHVGEYRLAHVLGAGATSVVYLAERLDDARTLVAIKVLTLPEAFPAPERETIRDRFLREALAATRLKHDHILPVIGYGEADGLDYLVMPLVAGGTLAERLEDAHGRLPLAVAAAYLTQLAAALDYAHRRGVVHRDVKPSNALLARGDHVYLSDFGIAGLFDVAPDALTGLAWQQTHGLTRTGEMLGTVYYMAPEQIKAERGKPIGPPADIYALGALTYELVTGEVPFPGEMPLTVAMQHLQQSPPPPRRLRRELPPAAEAAILRALAKEPGDRFPSATAFAQAFAAGLADPASSAVVSGAVAVPTADRAAGASAAAPAADLAPDDAVSAAGSGPIAPADAAPATSTSTVGVAPATPPAATAAASIPIVAATPGTGAAADRSAVPVPAALAPPPAAVPAAAGPPGGSGAPPGDAPSMVVARWQGLDPTRRLAAVSAAALLVVVAVGLVVFATHRGGPSPAPGHPTAVVHTSPTAVRKPSPTPTPTVIDRDALTSPSNGWFDDGTHCFFATDGYHVKGTGVACPSTAVSAGDLDLSIQVVQLAGPLSDQYGIEIRRDTTGSPANYYAFDIDGAGHWAFFKCTTSSGQCMALISKSDAADPRLHRGLNAANTIEVRAVGTHFFLILNGKPVGQVNDAAFASGIIGPEIGGADECVFSNLLVTKPAA